MSPDARECELFEHGADVGVRGRGETMDRAFANAALALTSVIADPQLVRRSTEVDVIVTAPDLDVLLVQWLNEIVFEMATRHMLFSRFDVAVQPSAPGWRLSARLWGERVDPARHRPTVEVKGATFTALAVSRADGGWCAQCVVDV